MKSSLVLASQSPRRLELLSRMNFEVHVLPSHIEEKFDSRVNPTKIAKELAMAKADACLTQYCDREIINQVPLLSADTLVIIGGEIIGKPENRDHARFLLQKLSGKTHSVITAYVIFDRLRKVGPVVRAVKSQVEMTDISEKCMDWYLAHDEAYDKAGAYAVQGLSAFFVKSITGSYTNVMGLPLSEVVEDLVTLFGMELR
jgi:septum formation protein